MPMGNTLPTALFAIFLCVENQEKIHMHNSERVNCFLEPKTDETELKLSSIPETFCFHPTGK